MQSGKRTTQLSMNETEFETARVDYPVPSFSPKHFGTTTIVCNKCEWFIVGNLFFVIAFDHEQPVFTRTSVSILISWLFFLWRGGDFPRVVTVIWAYFVWCLCVCVWCDPDTGQSEPETNHLTITSNSSHRHTGARERVHFDVTVFVCVCL